MVAYLVYLALDLNVIFYCDLCLLVVCKKVKTYPNFSNVSCQCWLSLVKCARQRLYSGAYIHASVTDSFYKVMILDVGLPQWLHKL